MKWWFTSFTTGVSYALCKGGARNCACAHRGGSTGAQTKDVAERLWLTLRNAKLLIVHADDLAVAHSVNAASFDALDIRRLTPPVSWCVPLADGGRGICKNHPAPIWFTPHPHAASETIFAGGPWNPKTESPVCLICWLSLVRSSSGRPQYQTRRGGT